MRAYLNESTKGPRQAALVAASPPSNIRQDPSADPLHALLQLVNELTEFLEFGLNEVLGFLGLRCNLAGCWVLTENLANVRCSTAIPGKYLKEISFATT